MCKKLRVYFSLIVVLIVTFTFGVLVYAENNIITSSYDGVTVSAATNVENSLVTIIGNNDSGKKLKILINKDDIVGKWYNVQDNRHINETVSLLDGDGLYKIYMMIQANGNQYSYGPYLEVNYTASSSNINNSNLEYKTEIVKNSNLNYGANQSNSVSIDDNSYLNSSTDVNSENGEIIALSKKLTEGKRTDSEKIQAIYSWIVKNLSYDYDKYNNILRKDFSDQYGSSITLETKKGVCYDYATLVAALCRAANVSAKVDKGYSKNVIGYHAWNEVYDSENNIWIIIDTSIDSIRYHNTGNTGSMIIRSEDEYYATEQM